MKPIANLLDYKLRRIKEEKRHKKNIDSLNQLLKEFQKTCEHPKDKKRYYPDLARSHDSYYFCTLCDKIF